MSSPFTGHGTYAGFATEVTWGSAVSPRTNWLRVISINPRQNFGFRQPAHLGNQGQASRNMVTPGSALGALSEQAGLDIEIEAAYNDSTAFLLAECMGASSFADSGAGPYTHTGNLKGAQTVGFTCDAGLGNGESQVFAGNLVDNWSLSCEAGSSMKLRVATIARTAAMGSLGSPTYNNSAEVIESFHSGQLTLNAVAVDMISFAINVNNNLTRRQFLGSAQTQKPASNGFQEVTGQFVVEYSSDSAAYWSTVHLGNVIADAGFAFTGTGGSLTAVLHNLQIMSVDRQVRGAGIVRMTLNVRMWADTSGTDQGLKLTLVNANATMLVN